MSWSPETVAATHAQAIKLTQRGDVMSPLKVGIHRKGPIAIRCLASHGIGFRLGGRFPDPLIQYRTSKTVTIVTESDLAYLH
jgi:hypothetical protein